jgi:hypothetical protein
MKQHSYSPFSWEGSYIPNGSGPFDVVVTYTRKQGSILPPDQITFVNSLVAQGYMAVMVNVCGMGEVGDAFLGGIDSGESYAVDMATEVRFLLYYWE